MSFIDSMLAGLEGLERISDKKPLNISITNVDETIKQNNFKEVTSNFIKEPSSTSFHPDGLFSEEIFGAIGTDDRLTTFGYITLNTTVFHPKLYKNLLYLKKSYKDILNSSVYVKFDESIKDFVKVNENEEDGNTGFIFFLKHFNNIDFQRSDSIERNDKIDIFNKYSNNIFLDKWLVLPAGVRDIQIEDGHQQVEDINKYYNTLLNLSRAIPPSGRDNPMYDNIRYSIQLKIVEIYDYIENILSGKKGFLQRKYGSRSIALGTRNVATSISLSSSSIEANQFIDVDETLMGVYHTVKCFQPCVIYYLKTLFFDLVFDSSDDQVAAIDTKDHSFRYIQIDASEKNKYLSSDGLNNLIKICRHSEYRSRPITITNTDTNQPYYLFMVYDTGDTISIFRNKSEFKYYRESMNKEFNEDYIRPLTYNEMLYFCAWMAIVKKHVLVTRYPVLGPNSIYPSKIHLTSTVPARSILLDSLFSNEFDQVLPNYPILGNPDFNSVGPHTSKINSAWMNCDFDGDMLNVVGIMTQESNEEIDNYLNNINSVVGLDGKLTVGCDKIISNMTFLSLSKMPKIIE